MIHFDWFLIDFWMTFDWFLNDFWLIFDWFWMIFDWFWLIFYGFSSKVKRDKVYARGYLDDREQFSNDFERFWTNFARQLFRKESLQIVTPVCWAGDWNFMVLQETQTLQRVNLQWTSDVSSSHSLSVHSTSCLLCISSKNTLVLVSLHVICH